MSNWNQNAGYGQRFLDSLPFTAGKIFIVAQTTYAGYDIISDLFPPDPDGTVRLHATIQSALDAAVTNRDDYIIVLPDANDYDITEPITVTKDRIHIIAPSGLGHKGFPSNSVRVHQETAAEAIFTVTGHAVEIAGFFFKQSTGDGIDFSTGTVWHPHIHDCFFGMACTDGTDAYGITGTGAVNHYSIHDNYFNNYSPGAISGTDNDLGSFIYFSAGGCTRGLIKDNIFMTGANTEVTSGIVAMGIDIIIDNNILAESKASAPTEDGTLTKGITTGPAATVCRNLFSMDGDNEVTGGAANESYVQNFEATTGGVVVV